MREANLKANRTPQGLPGPGRRGLPAARTVTAIARHPWPLYCPTRNSQGPRTVQRPVHRGV